MSSPSHYLSWRGRQSGPFTPEEINAQLRSGEISGLHLIHHEGAWIPLEEFLTVTTSRAPVMLPTAGQTTPSLNAGMEHRIADLEPGLQRRGPAAPHPAVHSVPTTQPPAPQGSPPPAIHRTSAMAVVAFIGSLTSTLFLFLWPVAAMVWLLSVIFGHASVSECQRNPALGGRGLAIAALAISYLTLLLFGAWVLYLRSRLH